jgi:hypothetical protein
VDDRGDTPLHVAGKLHYNFLTIFTRFHYPPPANLTLTPAIPILLAQGADKTIVNKEGHTALKLAKNMVCASAVHKESPGLTQIYNGISCNFVHIISMFIIFTNFYFIFFSDEVGVQAQICVDLLI